MPCYAYFSTWSNDRPKLRVIKTIYRNRLSKFSGASTMLQITTPSLNERIGSAEVNGHYFFLATSHASEFAAIETIGTNRSSNPKFHPRSLEQGTRKHIRYLIRIAYSNFHFPSWKQASFSLQRNKKIPSKSSPT